MDTMRMLCECNLVDCHETFDIDLDSWGGTEYVMSLRETGRWFVVRQHVAPDEIIEAVGSGFVIVKSRPSDPRGVRARANEAGFDRNAYSK